MESRSREIFRSNVALSMGVIVPPDGFLGLLFLLLRLWMPPMVHGSRGTLLLILFRYGVHVFPSSTSISIYLLSTNATLDMRLHHYLHSRSYRVELLSDG